MKLKIHLFFLFFIFANPLLFAQKDTPDDKPKFSMAVLKDTLDGKLDMSDFLIHYHGFIPVIQLITEPALGSIGLMAAPLFIKPNKHGTEGENVAPDITMGFVAYTANKTWGFGGGRMASLPRHHLKYRVGAAYGDVNLDFFRTFPVIGQQEFPFNFNMAAAFGSLLRQIGKTDLYVGLEYLYLNNKVKPEFDFDNLPDFIGDKDLKNNLSSIGIVAEYDNRDNIFTPNTGWYISTSYKVNASWTGSDYDYENLNLSVLKYVKFSPKWVSGFRFESTFQFGDAPFYMEPSISLRGVPMAKYQGEQTYVLETEQRYDWNLRWSSVVFAGMAKAPTERESFKDVQLVYNYGTGFRYLIARKFKMRAGVDVAWSNNDFGWYVIFGSAWNNRN